MRINIGAVPLSADHSSMAEPSVASYLQSCMAVLDEVVAHGVGELSDPNVREGCKTPRYADLFRLAKDATGGSAPELIRTALAIALCGDINAAGAILHELRLTGSVPKDALTFVFDVLRDNACEDVDVFTDEVDHAERRIQELLAEQKTARAKKKAATAELAASLNQGKVEKPRVKSTSAASKSPSSKSASSTSSVSTSSSWASRQSNNDLTTNTIAMMTTFSLW